MNCKKCGSQLVLGQIICSNCGEENYENQQLNNFSDVNNTMSNNFSDINNTMSNNFSDINNTMSNNINVFDNDIKIEKTSTVKQNIMLKISSIFALIAGIAMFINCVGTLSIKARVGELGFIDLIQILIAIVMILNAFFISNFNLGKNKFFDNKVIFLVFLCIDFFAGLELKIYFVVFILSLVGFIISCKNKIN